MRSSPVRYQLAMGGERWQVFVVFVGGGGGRVEKITVSQAAAVSPLVWL